MLEYRINTTDREGLYFNTNIWQDASWGSHLLNCPVSLWSNMWVEDCVLQLTFINLSLRQKVKNRRKKKSSQAQERTAVAASWKVIRFCKEVRRSTSRDPNGSLQRLKSGDAGDRTTMDRKFDSDSRVSFTCVVSHNNPLCKSLIC